jgi:serine/threonine-protein kinase HipA
MTTSNSENHKEAFVWIWLPGATEPVVAGKLFQEGNTLVFNYGQSYLERNNAIPIYDKELPLRPGILPLLKGLNMPGCLRDASPDAWGRRVIINKKLGVKRADVDETQLDELTFLLESGSDRIGALDFQRSATDYEPRSPVSASLEELLASAERVEKGIPLTSSLDQALFHGSSIGGARPKTLIEDNDKKYVAKFPLTTDIYNFVKAEFIAMRLAKVVGLDVAPVFLAKSSNKDVLLIERFDRIKTSNGWQRKSMVSSLTLFGLDELMARYASYGELTEIIRHKFINASSTLKELFSRLTFNILVGNTDDHARNHAAFWDGKMLSLTPAYDICPQPRSGGEAAQAMLISDDNRMSRIGSCLDAAKNFLLSRKDAVEIIEKQITKIGDHWSSVCGEAELSEVDQNMLWGRQFLNPYAFESLTDDTAFLKGLASRIRESH